MALCHLHLLAPAVHVYPPVPPPASGTCRAPGAAAPAGHWPPVRQVADAGADAAVPAAAAAAAPEAAAAAGEPYGGHRGGADGHGGVTRRQHEDHSRYCHFPICF